MKQLIWAALLLIMAMMGGAVAGNGVLALAGSGSDTVAGVLVPLYGSGYVFPRDARKYGWISEKGWQGWKDADGYARVYFLPAQSGALVLSVQVSKAEAGSKLLLRLDGKGKVQEVTVPVTGEVVVLAAGSVHISTVGYHYIEIRGKNAGGNALPEVTGLVMSGVAATGLRFNNSQYQGAPATHLSYPLPKDSAAEWFYGEISVPEGADPLHAYYMVNGFSGGYFGIQVNGPTERRVLFSVWSNYKTNDPGAIPADYAVKLLAKGADVHTGEFGNEGSGGQSFWKFMWKPETTYRLLLHAEAAGDHTIFSAWFYAPESGNWKFIARWDQAKSGGKLLRGLYSFVENFGDNGYDFFKARYGNQWVRTPGGTWVELTRSTFSTTANAIKHPRFDWGGGVEGKWLYMYSGGFREEGNVHQGSVIERPSGGVPPAVDLLALPNQ